MGRMQSREGANVTAEQLKAFHADFNRNRKFYYRLQDRVRETARAVEQQRKREEREMQEKWLREHAHA